MIKGLCQEISTNTLDKSLNWLKEQANNYKLNYLLAHAEDGVIWGKLDGDKLTTSNEAFPDEKLPELRLKTLQQCRIFGEKGEVLLWGTANGWKARVIQHLDSWQPQEDPKEIPGGELKCFKIPGNDDVLELIEEHHILWGTKPKGEEKKGFTLMLDGSEGLKHAVPLTGIKFKKKEELYRPVRLVVHHYIDYDDSDDDDSDGSGVAKISLSRLVELKQDTQKD